MRSTMEQTLAVIDAERNRLAERWRGSGQDMTVGDFVLVLDDLVAAARRQMADSHGPEAHHSVWSALHTMRKIAATAVLCMERHGAIGHDIQGDTP